MILRLSLLALTLCGCATTPELTILAGKRHAESERDFAVTIMLLQKFGENGHGIGGCAHTSEPGNGAPVNHEPEETAELCGFGGRWGGK